MRQATCADEEIKSGKMRSPLHGVPWAPKDLLAVKDVPTHWGSPAQEGRRLITTRWSSSDCVMRVACWSRAAMIELAGGGGYENCGASITGPCKCPFDESRWAGGRIEQWIGRAVGGGLVGFRDRDGNLGFDHGSRGILQRQRPATDLRPRAAAGRDGSVFLDGQDRPDGAIRRRLCGNSADHLGS